MSSTLVIENLLFVTQQINIFVGISIFVVGVIGGLLTITVFLSLQTFRQSSCAFYLIIMSFVNIGQLLTGLLSRITINTSGIDWTQLSLFYCTFRSYLLVVCTDASMLCVCLATLDQYLATCHRPRWQQWSHLKIARRLAAASIIFCLLIAIPQLFYTTYTISSSTGNTTCIITNGFFIQFNVYFYRLFMSSILPLVVTLVFGVLTYRNVKQIAYRTVPLVRRELDKQLTAMILVQDIFTYVTLFPATTIGFVALNPTINQSALSAAQFQLANTIALMFYYLYFAGPFYIYICISERFRQQLKYVIIDIHLNRWRQPKPILNRVAPQNQE